MSALPLSFPRVPLKKMDSSMLIFELDRETHRLMPEASEMITSAATLASFLHREQTRFVRGDLPRVPYIEHPLRVALRLIRWGARDPQLVAAALLHDVVEDCAEELLTIFGDSELSDEEPLECLARLYGERVAALVGLVTTPPESQRSHEGYWTHMQELAGSGSSALLIKASDLKDNAGSIKHQLGHGDGSQDARMLRRVRKYMPAVPVIREGLGVLAESLSPTGSAARAAIADMGQLESCLAELVADEH